jgi:hypothetical protein
MLTPEEHTKLLGSFEVDRLLKMVTIEAKRLHDGHFTILAFTTNYKVAFGTPEPDHMEWVGGPIWAMPGFKTLKEALIHALVSGKDFDDYGHSHPWWSDTRFTARTAREGGPDAEFSELSD